MNLSTAIIWAALCLGLTVGQMQLRVYRGTLVHSRVPEQIEVLQNYLLGFDANNLGEILFVAPSSQLESLAQRHSFNPDEVITLTDSQFLMPGLVDCHIHAEQITNAGAKYEKPFQEWVFQDFFPTGQQFGMDPAYARNTSSLLVRWTLQHGTTTVAYSAPSTQESNRELVRVIAQQNQRALVGRTAAVFSVADPTVEQSINETMSFVQFIRDLEDPLIEPLIWPAIFDTLVIPPGLVEGLGRIARELNVNVQTHIAESDPIPDGGNLTILQDWEQAGLLPPNMMNGAHAVYLRDNELEYFRERNLSIGHCPNSNLNFRNGILDVRKVLRMGINIGLGTDISAGYSPSMFNAMRVAIHASKALSLTVNETDYQPLTHHEAFYLATMGGAEALGLSDTVGNFQVGKQFDALLVDTRAPDASNPVFFTFPQDSMADIIEKFIYLSDERNIQRVFVAGRDVTPTALTTTPTMPAPAVCSAIKPVVPLFVLCMLQLILSLL